MEVDEPTGSSDVTKPPPMRAKPQVRWVGPGKRYATRAHFDADMAKWEAEREARRELVAQWNKQRDRGRDRSGRVQQSGAQHRRLQGMTESERDAYVNGPRRERERRDNYYKSMRERGKRVRVLRGEFAGQSGALMYQSAAFYTVQLDATQARVKVPAGDLELWPCDGQKINFMAGCIEEVATVVKFSSAQPMCEPDAESRPGDWNSMYQLKRTLYALRWHVEAIKEKQVRVGAHVHLLPPHEDLDFLRDAETNPEGHEDAGNCLIVKAICASCDCVELEHTWVCPDACFGELDLPDALACPPNHRYKCSHVGHRGSCTYKCVQCGGLGACAPSLKTCKEAEMYCHECDECQSSDDEDSEGSLVWLSE